MCLPTEHQNLSMAVRNFPQLDRIGLSTAQKSSRGSSVRKLIRLKDEFVYFQTTNLERAVEKLLHGSQPGRGHAVPRAIGRI
jgi:hypothetical protein